MARLVTSPFRLSCFKGVLASATLNLDLCPDFMGDVVGAGLISISQFTNNFAYFRGYQS